MTFQFMVEPRFNLESDTRRIFIWREPGTRFHLRQMREKDTYGSCSVCVWGGKSLGGCTDLEIFPRRNVNSRTYREVKGTQSFLLPGRIHKLAISRGPQHMS
ncbi:transposable element Tcb2 transposase [Trichonephila clavipes]|nr:transposable element Tcb2 transposase [Trichonephila clavipes]